MPPACTPPNSLKFSQIHAVFLKIWQNHMLVHPRELVPPPMGNPGSAPQACKKMVDFCWSSL